MLPPHGVWVIEAIQNSAGIVGGKLQRNTSLRQHVTQGTCHSGNTSLKEHVTQATRHSGNTSLRQHVTQGTRHSGNMSLRQHITQGTCHSSNTSLREHVTQATRHSGNMSLKKHITQATHHSGNTSLTWAPVSQESCSWEGRTGADVYCVVPEGHVCTGPGSYLQKHNDCCHSNANNNILTST